MHLLYDCELGAVLSSVVVTRKEEEGRNHYLRMCQSLRQCDGSFAFAAVTSRNITCCQAFLKLFIYILSELEVSGIREHEAANFRLVVSAQSFDK